MKLIVGLGNPGKDYAYTRHNIGFMAIDAIQARYGVSGFSNRFQGELAEVRVNGEKLILLKPMTFMNLSGQAAGEAARFYKIPVEDIIAFHDELDLAPAKLKVKQGGGHAGHNGLKSLNAHLGENYVRVRMGIGHPGAKHLVSNYVLGNFAKSDQDWLQQELDAVVTALPKLIEGDIKAFQGAITVAMKSNEPVALSPEVEAGKPGREKPPFKVLEPEKPLSPFDKLKSILGKD
jgi:PTH1 family peptidyl-tRNA hydrolase